MSTIESATGNARGLKVDDDNRARVLATVEEVSAFLNRKYQRTWNYALDALAPSGANYFFVLTNLSNVRNLHAELLSIASSVAGVYRLEAVSVGTLAGNTGLTPAQLTVGSTRLPDETSKTIFGAFTGANITGITAVMLLRPITVEVSKQIDVDLRAHIVLPPGASIALKAPAAATVNGALRVFETTDDTE